MYLYIVKFLGVTTSKVKKDHSDDPFFHRDNIPCFRSLSTNRQVPWLALKSQTPELFLSNSDDRLKSDTKLFHQANANGTELDSGNLFQSLWIISQRNTQCPEELKGTRKEHQKFNFWLHAELRQETGNGNILVWECSFTIIRVEV